MDFSTVSGEGFEVATCPDPSVAELGELKPDLIIVGEGLALDSFEVCCRLRRLVDVPILMLGSIPRATGWIKAAKSGADCYLEKPVASSELVARMKAILRRCKWNLEQK
jgi:DNA-binding response OmpR family regulator